MELVVIAALAEKNRVIGRGMDLPWRLPTDLKRFKRLTSGHPMIMGRRTFDSLIEQFGGPLPNRRHLVLSRHPERITHPVAEPHFNLASALDAVADEPIVFIAGGGTLYAQTIADADRLELTLVEGDHEGDAFFPAYAHLIGPTYRLKHLEPHEGFRFETYVRHNS